MKQRVILSTVNVISTILFLLIFVYIIIRFFTNNQVFGLTITFWLCLLASLLLAALFYMPMSISADKYAIYIHRSLRIKAIPMMDVKSVCLCPPTMGAKRIFASGGFFGYWGWFYEKDLGKYFAYYGRSSDCFLVELKDGRKYMLGCKNPQKMVEYISSMVK